MEYKSCDYDVFTGQVFVFYTLLEPFFVYDVYVNLTFFSLNDS